MSTDTHVHVAAPTQKFLEIGSDEEEILLSAIQRERGNDKTLVKLDLPHIVVKTRQEYYQHHHKARYYDPTMHDG